MPYEPYGFNQYQYGALQPQQNFYSFVNGIEGAKSFIVKPNQTVLLMDSEAPVCYMKQSNGFGQSTIRYFKLVEVREEDLKQPKEVNDGMAILEKKVAELEEKIQKLQVKGE